MKQHHTSHWWQHLSHLSLSLYGMLMSRKDWHGSAVLQQHLMDNLDNNDYQVEDVLYMSKLVCIREVPDLHWLCLKVIANSDIDNFALEREIPGEAFESVKRFRLELGHEEGCRLEQVQEMQCRAIHRQCSLSLVDTTWVPGKWVT